MPLQSFGDCSTSQHELRAPDEGWSLRFGTATANRYTSGVRSMAAALPRYTKVELQPGRSRLG
jgi:hypothetical protein